MITEVMTLAVTFVIFTDAHFNDRGSFCLSCRPQQRAAQIMLCGVNKHGYSAGTAMTPYVW
jgi:hypothetical protein